MEYESSDDDEPIKQQRVGTEAMQRPQYQTSQFVKQIDKMTRDKLGEKQKMVRPDFVVPHTNLNTNMRNDPLLYVAPMIYVWDPPSQYGVEVKCQGGDHKMHLNQWRDCLAYDLRAIFLGQEIPYPEFIKFEDYMYVPCRALIKEIILQHWERYKDFYFWHMAMMGADKCSADMTSKRAKFIVTKQGKRYAPQWKGVYQILNEAGKPLNPYLLLLKLPVICF